MDYLDFELCVGQGEGGSYPLSVVRSPAGEQRATMAFPLDEAQLRDRLQRLEIALLKSGSTRRDLVAPEEHADVEAFGRTLFETLLPEEIRSSYRISRQMAQQQGKGLRLRLRIEAPDLAALPWEFMYDEAEGDFVCLSSDTPLVRYLELNRPVTPVVIEPPLRILGMIASPGDRAALDVARERERMTEALRDLDARGLATLTWLEGQTTHDLQRAMRQGPWHIFHFVGHGGFDRATGEGMLALADADGGTALLPATKLGRLLADHATLQLAVLNACEGAQASDANLFSSTASVLIRRGIPAVVAMQYEITDAAAIEFSHEFYQSVSEGLPVDAAVAEARKAVSLSAANTVEWGTPVLYLRSPDGRLFDVDAAAATAGAAGAAAQTAGTAPGAGAAGGDGAALPTGAPAPVPTTASAAAAAGGPSALARKLPLAALLAVVVALGGALAMWAVPRFTGGGSDPADDAPGPPPPEERITSGGDVPDGVADDSTAADFAEPWMAAMFEDMERLDRERDAFIREGDRLKGAVGPLSARAPAPQRAEAQQRIREADGLLERDDRASFPLPPDPEARGERSVREHWRAAQREIEGRRLRARQRRDALADLGDDLRRPQPSAAPIPAPVLSACRTSPSEVVADAPMTVGADVAGASTVRVDFGDGTTASRLPATHTYTDPGLHTVTITATSAGGSDACTRQVYVQLPPVASPGLPVLPGCRATPSVVGRDEPVSIDADVAGARDVQVDFGDGTTASRLPARHAYRAPGTYQATLSAETVDGPASCTVTVVVDGGFCDSVTELNSVHFEYGEARLAADGRSRLDENIQLLRGCSAVCLTLATYSDGEEGDEERVTRDRAAAVLGYYLANGLSRSRVRVEARGIDPDASSKEDPGPGDWRARRADSRPTSCGAR